MVDTRSHTHIPDGSAAYAEFSKVFSQEQLREFIKYCPNAAAIFDRNMVYLACSDRHLRDFGLTEEQVIGKNHYAIFPELPQKFHEAHQRALRGHVVKNENDMYKAADGTIRYTNWECRPWHDADGKIGGIFLYTENTTERIRVLQESKDQAERDKKQLAAVLANLHSGVVVFDMEGNVIHANDALARILEYKDKSELPVNIGFFERLFRRFSYPERKEVPFDDWPLKRVYRGETVNHEKFLISQLDTGQERIVEYFGTLVCNAEGAPELALLMVTDITKRQQAEEELRKTKEFAEQEQSKWLAVLDHVSNGVAVFEASTNQIYANDRQLEMYGLVKGEETLLTKEFIASQFVVQTYPDLRDLKSDEWPAPRVLGGEYLDEETFYVKRLDWKRARIVMISGAPVYNAQGQVELAVIVSNDITQQVEREKQNRVLQERMEQAQRLESLGVLAGGIAHDFNNLLMAILGNADIALMKLVQPSPAAKNLENIRSASTRAADLCSQLLAYSGQGKMEEKDFSLSRLVREMSQILNTSISPNCVLNLNLEEPLPMTFGDSSQMQQIVLDLVKNASDAIGGSDGTINISTGSMQCTQDSFTDDYVIKPMNSGRFVTLEVSDNGPGMNKETLGRIFEPFFTTKFTGRGLGLSAVLGIVRSHGGGLRVSSEPGAGTTFSVLFPAVQGTGGAYPDSVEKTDAKKKHPVGRVLLIDDEDMVLEVCRDQLELLGVEVLIARDGQEGVEVYRKMQAEIDLVILDLIMPRMGGEETFRILRQLNPEVKVLMASGYTEEEMTPRFTEEKPSGYLRKPYTFAQLSDMISNLLPRRR